MAFTISRTGHTGGRPVLAGGGRSGARTTYSASVMSLAKRRPSRICCARVAAVHMCVFIQLGLDNQLESPPTVATQSPFSRSLPLVAVAGRQ